MKFKKNSNGGNELLQGDGFFISYNPNPGMGFSIFKGDNGSDETALVKPDDENNEYRILNGDYRESYEKLVSCGFEACLEFYDKMSVKNDSSWSTHNCAI